MTNAPSATHHLSDKEFQLFQKLFEEEIGLHLVAHKKLLLSGRLGRRLGKLGLPSFRAYYDHLVAGNDPAELQTAIDLITTHETFFFREAHHFDVLMHSIVPAHAPGRPLRVWSAACSTGEEPYSVAMVLSDVLGPTGWELLASDISDAALAKAAAGLYSMARTEGISQKYLKAYCLRGRGEFEGKLLIERSLREKIEFRQLNLTNLPSNLGKFDVVLLRNVIIYFDTSTKLRVLEAICDRLQPGGWLLLGHSESMAGFDLPIEQIKPAVYRRRR